MLRAVFLWLSEQPSIFGFVRRNGLARKLASRFVAGETVDEAIATARELNGTAGGLSVSLDLLGESVLHAAEAERACATYLTTTGDDGRPIDPVARFHLGNGARLWHLAGDADRSERGMQRSFGLMANYRYEPEDRAANAEALRQGRPALGPGVAALLRGGDADADS